jgi:hypothetical protein
VFLRRRGRKEGVAALEWLMASLMTGHWHSATDDFKLEAL